MKAIAAALPLLAWACGPTAPRADLGAIAATDARIAVVTDDTALLVYVCGGPTTMPLFTRWLVGPLGATRLENGDLSLSLSITSTGASGRVMVGTSAWSFEADRAPDDADAGLFGALDRGCRTGVIVDPARGAQGVWCDGEGRFAQVDPGAPMAFGPERFEVSVTRPDGPGRLEVERVQPSALFSDAR